MFHPPSRTARVYHREFPKYIPIVGRRMAGILVAFLHLPWFFTEKLGGSCFRDSLNAATLCSPIDTYFLFFFPCRWNDFRVRIFVEFFEIINVRVWNENPRDFQNLRFSISQEEKSRTKRILPRLPSHLITLSCGEHIEREEEKWPLAGRDRR